MAYEIIHTQLGRISSLIYPKQPGCFFHYSHVPVSAPKKGIELKPSLLSTSCAGISLTTTSLLGIIVGLASGILTGAFGAVRRLTRGTKWSIPSFKNDCLLHSSKGYQWPSDLADKKRILIYIWIYVYSAYAVYIAYIYIYAYAYINICI